jgi:exodeoxyribonuclease V alpha subunit
MCEPREEEVSLPTSTKNAPSPTETETEIAGRVEHLRYQSPRFSVGTLITPRGRVTFSIKGYIRTGDHIQLTGKWETHAKYGKQFTAEAASPTAPADPAGLKIWLTWTVPGVGSARAAKLVDEFGMNLPERCLTEPEIVAAAGQVSLAVVQNIASLWQEFASNISAITELAALGLTQHQVEVLMARFRGTAATMIKEDPYLMLGEVEGLGWAKIDEIAQKVGVQHSDPRRVRAAIEWTVREASKDGHTCQPAAETHTEVLDKLSLRADGVGCDEVSMIAAADRAEELKRLHVIKGDGYRYYASPVAWKNESLLWKFFATATHLPNSFITPASADRVAQMYRTIPGPKGKAFELDDGQLAAVELAARHKVAVITGGAGAGKTLVARAIAKMYADADVDVTFAAPTGKAARRLEEVTGREASTIHRLLGIGGEARMDVDRSLPEGLVIVDEVSMIDSALAAILCKAVGKKTVLVLIGDDNQLSPVGPGAVLRDVLAHNLAPIVRLKGCHRQAGTLKSNCSAVLLGRVEPSAMDENPIPWAIHRNIDSPELIAKAMRRLFEEYLATWGHDPVAETQFLTAMHKGPYGTKYLNKLVQQLRQKTLPNGAALPDPNPGDDRRGRPMVGDKVIQTENNYKLNVMNGHQGVVVTTDPVLAVKFEGNQHVVYPPEARGQVELGYVLTPHKAQGSEWPCVVVVCPKAHSFMQHRNWVYTAVTRAQKTCVVIGDDKGIRYAAERIETDRRQTLLSLFAVRTEARP